MKLNNKGYTLNLTIILMIVVTIICTSCLAIVIANYNMKKSESDVSSSTYTAETAIDDIRSGIQQQCSEDMKVVYTTLTSSMNTIPWNKLDDEFSALYKERLSDKYSTKTAETLSSYIRAGSDYELITEPTFEIKSDRKMFLRNVGVSYKTSSGNYTSKLYTDIEIDVPKLFDNMKTQTVNSTAYSDFVIIADGSVSLYNIGNIRGSIYSGGNIYLNKSNVIANKVLARKNLYITPCADAHINAESENKISQVYCDNIYTEYGGFVSDIKSALTAVGDFYVSHDLTLTYDYSKVTLSGTYHGFENDSSIALNNFQDSLDFTGLTTLYLAGVNQLDLTQNGLTASDSVTMGDSLGYKGQQFTYLVPESCITDKDGNILPNPMTKEQYDAGFTVNLEKEVVKGGTNLSYYAKGFKPVFISYKGYITDEKVTYRDTYVQDNNLCYLYLVFENNTKAAKYASLYADSHANLLNSEAYYFRLGNIAFGANTSLLTKGNVLTYDGSALSIKNNTSERLTTYLDNSIEYYRLKRNSILSTLDENSSSELIDSVFDYIIDRDKLKTDPVTSVNSNNGMDDIFYTYGGRYYSGTKSNAYGVVYYSYDKDKDYTVIITDADYLHIKKSIKGLIINTGEVQFTDSASNFTGLVLSGATDRTDMQEPLCVYTYNTMTMSSNVNGDYPLQYLLYESPDHDKLQRYFKVLQGGSTDIIPNVNVADTIKVRNRVTQ